MGTMKDKSTGFLWDTTHTLGVFGHIHGRVDATFVDRKLYFVVVPRDAFSPNLKRLDSTFSPPHSSLLHIHEVLRNLTHP